MALNITNQRVEQKAIHAGKNCIHHGHQRGTIDRVKKLEKGNYNLEENDHEKPIVPVNHPTIWH